MFFGVSNAILGHGPNPGAMLFFRGGAMQQPDKGGVFDRPKPQDGATRKPNPAEATPAPQATATPSEPQPKQAKEDFKSPFEQNEALLRDRATQEVAKPKESYAERTAEAINSATGGGADLTAEYQDAVSVSEADLELAQQLIFNGYAETDVEMPNMPGKKFTICSTNAEEMSMIDEIVFDMIKEKEEDDGRVDLPQNHIQTWRNAIYVALSYRGRDREELCSSGTHQLNTIKKAISRVSDLEMTGDMEAAEKLKGELKKALKFRALQVRRLGTPFIDFLSGKKMEFDSKMSTIMTSKNIIPKS